MTDEIPDDILAASFDLIEAMEANKADASTTSDKRYACLLTNDANLIARAIAAERAKVEAELASLKRLKSAYKAKNASKTRLLERVREVISDLVSGIVDEGDRAYFGSTNDADELRDLATKIEGWKWDDILRQSDGDPYATIGEQRRRADAAETELATLRAENERLREALVPFAEYPAATDTRLPGDMRVTAGSPMAARQCTVADFRRARAALKGGE